MGGGEPDVPKRPRRKIVPADLYYSWVYPHIYKPNKKETK